MSTRLTTWALQAGRKTVGEMQGSILFAGKKAKPAFLKRYTGYTEQFDTLIAGATQRCTHRVKHRRSIRG